MSLLSMVAVSLIATVLSDPRKPDNPIIACNPAFEALTGFGCEEIVGRNCRFLAGAATEPALTEEIRSGVRERRPVLVEILNYKKDGTAFRNAVLVAPIYDSNGDLEFFLGSQVELQDLSGSQFEQRRLKAQRQIASISPRQRSVLIEMASGKLNKQIAFTLGITERTVKMHRAAVLSALRLSSTADAIRIAVEAGY